MERAFLCAYGCCVRLFPYGGPAVKLLRGAFRGFFRDCSLAMLHSRLSTFAGLLKKAICVLFVGFMPTSCIYFHKCLQTRLKPIKKPLNNAYCRISAASNFAL